MRNALSGAALVAALAAAPAASADEVWTSPTAGRIVDEADIGDVAVFSYSGQTGRRAYLYVHGVPGSTERYLHQGDWIDVIEPAGVWMDGYQWYVVDSHIGQGYHWGGIFCTDRVVMDGVLQAC